MAAGGPGDVELPGDAKVPAGEALPVTFPVGDWFLGKSDGGIGGIPEGKKILSVTLTPNAKANARADAYALTPVQRRVEQDLGGGYALPGPDGGYAGELQLMEDHRSTSLVYSDLTDNSRWVCRGGPTPSEPKPEYEPPPTKMKARRFGRIEAFFSGNKVPMVPAEQAVAPGGAHPVLKFREPQEKVHVHLEDMAAGPARRVLWDAVYDLGGQETLKYGMPPLPGPASTAPDFHVFCPPRHGPPHWYELTVSEVKPSPGRAHMLDDFVASQTISAYRPDQEPEMMGFGEMPDIPGGHKCSVQ